MNKKVLDVAHVNHKMCLNHLACPECLDCLGDAQLRMESTHICLHGFKMFSNILLPAMSSHTVSVVNGVSAAAAKPKTFSQTYVKRLWQYSTTVNWESCEPTLEYIRYFKILQNSYHDSLLHRKDEIFKQCTHAHTHTHLHDNPTQIQQNPGPMIKALAWTKTCKHHFTTIWQSVFFGANGRLTVSGRHELMASSDCVLSRWISESTVTTVELVWNQTGVEFVWYRGYPQIQWYIIFPKTSWTSDMG